MGVYCDEWLFLDIMPVSKIILLILSCFVLSKHHELKHDNVCQQYCFHIFFNEVRKTNEKQFVRFFSLAFFNSTFLLLTVPRQHSLTRNRK